jgi:hypothetical protein
MAKKRLGNREIKARTDRRIEEVLDLIAAGAYSGRRTEQALAAKWSQVDGEPVAVSTAHNLAMQALRIHELRYKNDKEIRTRILARIDAIGDRAMANVRHERRRVRGGGYEMVAFPAPDFKSALKAAELVGKEFGMFELRLKLMEKDLQENSGLMLSVLDRVAGPEIALKVGQALLEELPDAQPSAEIKH